MARRQIIIRSTFAKTLDQKFRVGQPVYYATSFGSGVEVPGTIIGVGKENGDVVYDVQIEGTSRYRDQSKWGYEDQFRPRSHDTVLDGVGSPEEIAYGIGYHAMRSDPCPYVDPVLKAAWAKGRAKAKLNEKFSSNARRGEYPVGPGSKKTGFDPPRVRQSDSKDFNSELGWIAKIFAPNGKVVTQSDPFIKQEKAEAWLRLQLSKAQNAGLRATGRVFNGFFDPSQLQGA